MNIYIDISEDISSHPKSLPSSGISFGLREAVKSCRSNAVLVKNPNDAIVVLRFFVGKKFTGKTIKAKKDVRCVKVFNMGSKVHDWNKLWERILKSISKNLPNSLAEISAHVELRQAKRLLKSHLSAGKKIADKKVPRHIQIADSKFTESEFFNLFVLDKLIEGKREGDRKEYFSGEYEPESGPDMMTAGRRLPGSFEGGSRR